MQDSSEGLRISWKAEKDEILTIRGAGLPRHGVEVRYLEAFCRPGSTDRDWLDTVIPHTTTLLYEDEAGKQVRLESRLDDGVVVSHDIRASSDEIDFRLVAHNPTTRESAAHWAQPCIRVGDFTGFGDCRDEYAYISKCFIHVSDELATMPTPGWATSARYIPGQVWCPASVPRTDVNPRPLNPFVPGSGLIGCYSGDETMILATAWEPYQELFQGVIRCIHSDFRIGGLRPGESKSIRGKIYVVPNDTKALEERYWKDFPEHRRPRSTENAAPSSAQS